MGGTVQAPAQDEEDAPLTLPDVLSHSALTSFLSTLPRERVQALAEAHLPPGVPHDPEHLRRAIESPEFRRGAAGLDSALRTGALGPVVRSLGLPADAALGVEAFLGAVQKQAGEDDAATGGASAMQTD